MKIVVIGGSGLIGKKLIAQLKKLGHDAVSASPSTGVNTVTGEGLYKALKGAEVVVDLTNSPSFEDKAVLEFFKVSGHNLMTAEAAAKVHHHIALSIVNTDLLKECGYFRAKVAQEDIIKQSEIPYTIVRSTQFFEFLSSIAETGAKEEAIHMPTGLIQPIASDDVAAALVDVVIGKPLNGIIEIAGPERMPLAELVQRYFKAIHDPRKVIGDPHALYFGAELEELSLVPLNKAKLGPTNFEEWLKKQQAANLVHH